MMESRRRGACPGLSAPMPTGDGLLARLTPAAPVPLGAMAAFCEAARRHGNGAIEVTARGSLQVRGLTPHSAPLFAAQVGELGIAVHEGVPVIAAIDDGAADVLAVQLRRAITAARLALSPKVSVAVDGDGLLHLDGLSADVRLRIAGLEWGAQSSALRFHLGIGGNASGDALATTWLGTVALEDAVDAVRHVLAIIAGHGPAARAADVLRRDGIEAFHAIAAVDPSPAPPPRMPTDMIGLHATRDGAMALGVGLVFGSAHCAALAELACAAAHHGAQTMRPAPDRTLLLTGISALNVGGLTAAAERLGFIAHADDPRRRIAACPGAPACASGLIPARTIASTLSPALAAVGLERTGVLVHVSGCPKGCAHAAPAALTVVGTPQGCGVVYGGTAHEAPRHYVDPLRLGDEIQHIAAMPMETAHG
jgi:precorrin-3B synthase